MFDSMYKMLKTTSLFPHKNTELALAASLEIKETETWPPSPKVKSMSTWSNDYTNPQ